MDMNPFANTMTPQPQQPDYTKQDKNPTVPGAISNMVKAIMAGNNKFNQQRGALGDRVAAAASPATPPGPPMSLAPPAPGPSAGPMAPAPSPTMAPAPSPTMATAPSPVMAPAPAPPIVPPAPDSKMTGSAFDNGAQSVPFGPGGIMSTGMRDSGYPGMPNGTDPTVGALFSRIPGQGGYFGG